MVNNQKINKFELLSLFNKYMKAGKLEIMTNTALTIDKSLVNNRTDFSFKVPSYEEMIIQMKMWIDDHKNLYPHYF